MIKTFKTILGLILAWALVAPAGITVAQTPTITSMHTAATTTANGTALVVSGPAGNPANTIGAAGIQIANSAGTFAITFEALTSGSTWTAVMATNMTDDVRATTATAAGQYTVLLGGAVQLRARISACSSCSVTVVGRLVPGLVARVASSGGAGGTPGGSTTQLQYNNAGAFGGTPALVYSASADQTLKATPASGKTGMLVYEPGSTPPAQIQSAPSLLNLHVTNGATYWGLGYSSNGTTTQWANYLADDGSLVFGSNTAASDATGNLSFYLVPNTSGSVFGSHYVHPKGLQFSGVFSTYYGGMAEVSSDKFGLTLNTDYTGITAPIVPLSWGLGYIDHAPFGASAGNTTEHRYLELAANGSNYVGFKAPDAITANKIWTLPSADGTSGQLLSTNGSGVLGWSAGVPYSATASLDFGATAAGTCDTLTITVTGAANGDPVFLGIPNALAASDNYQQFSGYVSAADTVTVKRCNLTNAVTALSNPAAATVRATVFHY